MAISIYSSRELQAVLVRLKELPNEIRKQIRTSTRADALPIWQSSVRGHVQTALEAKVLLSTARVAVSNQNITLSSARVGRPLSGGLQPKRDYAAVEFGADHDKVLRYSARNKRGTVYDVRRRTQTQFKPRKPTGYVIYPAAAEAIPRIASLWVQTVMRCTFEALGM